MEFATKCLHAGYQPKNGEAGALPIQTCSPYQRTRAVFPQLSKLPLHTENQLATNSKMTLLAQNIACLEKQQLSQATEIAVLRERTVVFVVAVAVTVAVAVAVAVVAAAEDATAAAAAVGNGSFALKMSRGYVFLVRW